MKITLQLLLIVVLLNACGPSSSDKSMAQTSTTEVGSKVMDETTDKVKKMVDDKMKEAKEATQAVADKADAMKDKVIESAGDTEKMMDGKSSEGIEVKTKPKMDDPKPVSKAVEPKVSTKVEEVKTAVSTPSKSAPTTSPVSTTTTTATKAVVDKVVTKVEDKIPTAPSGGKAPPTKPLEETKPSTPVQTKPVHKAFTVLLSKHVSSSGKVNYEGFKSDIGKLDAYLKALEDFPPATGWSRAERLSYWINAYNAYTIKLIVDNYPVSSIQDINSGKPWDKVWINLAGRKLSLNAIENDIIRPTFNEPRIHFAVNCAAKSCPPLANKAFTKDNLESLLEARTVAFINDSSYNNLGDNPPKISKIFDWYGKDFGDVAAYINKYMNLKRPPVTELDYLDYNWDLNN